MTRRIRGATLPAVACVMVCAACAPSRPRPAAPVVSQSEWTIARDRLGALRDTAPRRPYVERVELTIVEPRTGRQLTARGAVAVSPGVALRMVLLGPAGTTALDAWVTREQFRFLVPAIDLKARGGLGSEGAGGLPVGFFRWWFLDPLPGRVLLGRASARQSAWLLRDGDATVTVRTDAARLVAVRRAGVSVEAVEWVGAGLAPRRGAVARYTESRYGLRVDVVVDEVLTTEPEPDAFLDPDLEGTAL